MAIQKTWQEAWKERINYSEIHDCIFIHIPKTAGSSIARLLGLEVSSHLTYQELIRTEFYAGNPELPVFAIVRDPLARFISLYNYARMPISAYHNNIEPNKALYGPHSDYQLLSDADLDDAIEHLIHQRLVHDRRWNQWLPQTFWTQGPEARRDPRLKVIHLEDLSGGLADVLGATVSEIPHLNASPGDAKPAMPSRQQLNKLTDYYRSDYEQFNYEIPS